LHNPPNLLGIKVARELLPNVPQVAVFDTAFHQTMPAHAFTYPIPYDLYEQLRVRRYGFHGTSHRYVAARAAKMLGRKLEETNLITAHLGNGASMTAIRNGKSIDTTMGLTPLEGLVMGTRSGDIDPAIIPFLARVKDMPVAQIDNLLNKKSGMLGVSGLSNDMRTIEQAAKEGHKRAELALEMYCYRIKKYVGAYTAAIGNVHALVFTAGVGENSDTVRERVCSNLESIGYKLDVEKNRSARGKEIDVATADSPVRILVIPTNEELMIAQDTYALTGK
jgi:acetate kinase